MKIFQDYKSYYDYMQPYRSAANLIQTKLEAIDLLKKCLSIFTSCCRGLRLLSKRFIKKAFFLRIWYNETNRRGAIV